MHKDLPVIVFLILIPFCASYAQELSGKVIDAETSNPLAYVHIGIFNRNMGVISRENGEFQIDLSKAGKNENLSFSIIGYETKSIPINNIHKSNMTVKLQPKVYVLPEIVINNSEIVDIEKFGRYEPTKFTTGQSGPDKYGFGGEWGLQICHDNKTYQVKKVSFHVRFNTMDSVLFRINIYNIKDSLPGESLLKKEVFVTSHKRQHWITADLTSQNLVISNDVIVTFELIRIWYSNKGDNELFFTHGNDYDQGHTYSRESSFDTWKIDKRPPITMYISGRVY